jgi:hypothetical protein
MADEFAPFRFEYISGAVDIFNSDGAFFFISVFNRGSTDGEARAVITNQDGTTIFDSQEQGVPPGRISVLGTQVDDPRLVRATYQARIFTNAEKLVPSARAYSVGDPHDEDTPPVTDVYFTPNDFARFVLPIRINLPLPIGAEAEQ